MADALTHLSLHFPLRGDYNFYVSSSEIPHALKSENLSEKVLESHGIELIINTARECSPTFTAKKIWSKLNIVYIERKISDFSDTLSGANENYLRGVIDYVERGNFKNILIHCGMGINRSMLVAGALYWHFRGGLKNGRELIDFLRQCNLRDRNYPALENQYFVGLLQKMCEKSDEYNNFYE